MYRKGVGLVLLNQNKNIFIAERIDYKNAWQMPQGGIDQNESPREALMRESLEEIGTNNFKIISKTDWLHYDIPQEHQDTNWHKKYSGQKQIWFLANFLGQDKDININTSTPEFSNYQWVAPQEVIDLIIDFKKPLYKTIINIFTKQGLL